MLSSAGYRLPTSADTATQTMTKQGAVRSLGVVQINMISGGGVAGSGAGTGDDPARNNEEDVVESWELHNAWVQELKFSDLDYETDELSEITVKLKYDFAKLNQNPSPVGGKLKVGAPSTSHMFTPAAIGEDPERMD